jgi:two-component system sensor histidine kinase DesK
VAVSAALTGLNLLFCSLALLFQYPWQSLVWIPAVSFIVGLVVNVEALNQQKDAALQLSQDEVRRLAATAERERIGRDLHDLLGHTLSLITLKLELARKLHDRGDARARLEIGEAEAIAREALAQVRSAVTGIRASDLAGELASARLLLECQQVHLHTPPPAMPVDVERGLALVLREAATNIVRHAQATRHGWSSCWRTHAGDADPRRWPWRRAGRGQRAVRHARTRGRPGGQLQVQSARARARD